MGTNHPPCSVDYVQLGKGPFYFGRNDHERLYRRNEQVVHFEAHSPHGKVIVRRRSTLHINIYIYIRVHFDISFDNTCCYTPYS
jgi:hypothetical protein